VQPREVGLPIHAYVAREEVKPSGTEKAQRVFVHMRTTVRHTEVEEIGVEHLLKDVKDATISTLSTEVAGKAQVRSPLLRCHGSQAPMFPQ
jgi:26S proteasome regulatory subunit N8